MTDMTNTIVMVTGAAGNLGGAVAHIFDEAGADLALLDRRSDRLKKVCGKIATDPRHLLIGSIDMTNPDDVRRGVDQTLDRFGRVDVLVNTTGGYRAGDPLHETSLETWDFMLNLNARTAFIACQAVIPHMLEVSSGRIINVGARPGIKGIARASAYSASKSAVIRLTESLSAEVKHNGIQVNCVLPGTLDTPENREAMPDAKHDRWVSPREVAEVIRFLASEASQTIHGAAIPCYGTG